MSQPTETPAADDADESSGCGYSGHEFGASYPDSCCIDGYLWDLDSCHEPGGDLTHGGEAACPQCNHAEWISEREEDDRENGYSAAEAGKSRESCPWPELAKEYPSDGEQRKTWWLAGYDEFSKS